MKRGFWITVNSHGLKEKSKIKYKRKIKFTKTRLIVKAIMIFIFTFDIFETSLTQKPIKRKVDIKKIFPVSYLIKVFILKNIGLF